MSWLPDDFTHPTIVPVLEGYHLRPIRATDHEIDYRAVMGSRDRLWSSYGPVWGWPPATLTPEQNRADLVRHEREMAAHESFDYALLNTAETALFGCVYVDPPSRPGADPAADGDAEVSWWVVDDQVGTVLADALDVLVPRWIERVWPFERPLLVGRDLSWAEWAARSGA